MDKKDNPRTGLEVAVIGMAGQFPGANNYNEFWENLKNGVESIAFFSDRELEKTGVNPGLINAPNYVRAKGTLENIEYFDASFFEYTPKEAEILNPQIRIFLQCSWEALEDAGYNPGTFNGLIGLFAGASSSLYWEGRSLLSGKAADMGAFAVEILTAKDHLCTITSYKLNLKGPSCIVQTACSTSLVAIHWACRAVLSAECHLALAGGITVEDMQKQGYAYTEGITTSPDGHCRAFDARAKGTNGGNGVGIVVLKRLKKAIADGDHIYAVVKGSAINNDGKRKVGFAAPSIEGQAYAIRTAMAMARVEPQSISYVETHGTATTLGDPIEIQALTLAFKHPEGTVAHHKHYCAIGSVKTNVGHLNNAAGAAGFIKTVLALKNRSIPPSLHFETPNPEIDFENSPFYVNRELQEWKNESYPLRAGVSSFGMGGTNAHVILEEAPEISGSVGQWVSESVKKAPGGTGGLAPSSNRQYQLILLSAKTQSALERMTRNLVEHFKKNPGINLGDAAYTLQGGRQAFKYRHMTVGSTVHQVVDKLSSPPAKKLTAASAGEEKKQVVFMFSGLGAQYVNMGRQLYENDPIFREETNRCFEILNSLLDYDIKEILYPASGSSYNRSNRSHTSHESHESYINQTEIAQLVVFIVEYATAKLLMHWGIKPYAMIGYSFGEYTAACTAGVLSLENVLKLVVSRVKLLAKISPGMMLSVPLGKEELKPLLNNEVSLAIDNGPSCLVAGTQPAIETFEKQMKEKKLLCMRLQTTHAIHSHMMEPLLKEFEQKVSQLDLNQPEIPYISNVTGNWITVEQATSPGYWARHLGETVQFADGIKKLLEKPNTVFIEIGPGRDLSTLLMRYIDNDSKQKAINTIRHPQKNTPDVAFLLNTLGHLWSWGVNIDWNNFHLNERRSRISLPAYPFERQTYGIEGNRLDLRIGMPAEMESLRKKPDIADWFYLPSWKRFRLSAHAITGIPRQTCWLIFMDDCGIGVQLIEELEKRKQKIVTVKVGKSYQKVKAHEFTLNPRPGSDNDYETLFRELSLHRLIPGRILHLWGLTSTDDNALEIGHVEESLDRGYYSLLNIARAIAGQAPDHETQITVVTNNMQEVTGDDNCSPGKAAVLGPVGVIPAEYPNIRCRSIDVVLPPPHAPREKELIQQVMDELTAAPGHPIVAYRGNHCWVKYFEPVKLEASNDKNIRLKQKGVYLITGGLGGIGLELAKFLAEKVHARLVLTGRTKFPPKNQWEERLTHHDTHESVNRKILKIKELEQLGAKVLVLNADTANREQMQTVINRAIEQFGPINGIIHSAGLPDGEMIALRTRQTSERIFTAKIKGTLVLDSLLAGSNPDFFVLCSSLGSLMPVIGQVSYCAANAFLDAYANYKASKNNIFTLAINWDQWRNVGMAAIARQKHKELTGQDPNEGMTARQGVEAFNRILAEKHPQVVLSTHDLAALLKDLDKVKISSLARGLEEASVSKTAGTYPRPEIDTKYETPENPTEQVLANLWASSFGFERVGVNDDFFELGGDSLKALVLVPKIHKELRIEISLTEFFKRPTIKNLARYIDSYAPKRAFTSILPAEKKEYYESSSAQERLYFLQQVFTGDKAYNMFDIIQFPGAFNPEKMKETFKRLIRRHDVLRTSFHIIEGKPIQKIHKNVPFEIEYYNQTQNAANPGKGDPSSFRTQFTTDTINNFVRSIDLSRAPLFRVGLIQTDPTENILLVEMHHIISDGSSMQILKRDFISLYSGESPSPLKIQYKDYTEWRNSRTQRHAIKRQEAYWLKEFAKDIPVLHLPIDYPRPSIQSVEGDSIYFDISRDETRALKNMTRETGSTMFMILLASLDILMSKLGGQEDIIMGTPAAGRRHTDLENLIGMFVNTLPLRNYPSGEKSFNDFLKEVTQRSLEAFENQDYHFEDLVEKVTVNRDTSRNPLFDVMFDFESTTVNINMKSKPREKETNRAFEDIEYNRGVAVFDMLWIGREGEEQLYWQINYCTKLFKKSTVKRLIHYFKAILSSVSRAPGEKISGIEILSREEKQRLLYDFNDTRAAYPREKTIHQLFGEQAGKDPDRAALAGKLEGQKPGREQDENGHVYITYKELNDKSHEIAYRLQEKTIQPDTIVGIMVNRSIEMVIGILGILKAGGAYLPIDPQYPEERIKYMLKDSNAEILLTADAINRVPTPLSIHPSTLPPFYPSNPSNLAYIIYTSGSTGRPKGVMVQHRSMVNACVWQIDYYSIDKRDHIAQYAPFVFDASILEIFPCLLRGASLYIVPEKIKPDPRHLNRYYEKMDITFSFLPTQFCELFMELENHSLRVLLAAGDRLRKFIKRNYRLYNNYGPTENTVVTTSRPVETQSHNIPIGTPIYNNQVYILDKNRLNLQPIGIPGELSIGGDSLCRGYLNRPELTAEKFDRDGYHRSYRSYRSYITNKSHIYRTGDLVRWLPDGNIEFIGRIDTQVKIRGYRVELGEIENQLLKQEQIKEAVVVLKENKKGDKFLCAYAVSDKELDIRDLKHTLAAELPDYMLPAYYVPIESLPLTANGKIDKKALPDPEPAAGTREIYIPPRDEVERKLCEIWSEILAIDKEKIGVTYNFFELGGNSLNLIMMVSKIYEHFHIQPSITRIYNHPVITGIANDIKTLDYTEGILVSFNPSADPLKKKNIFCIPPIIGYGYAYKNIADLVGDYAWHAFNFIEDSEPEERLEKYVKAVTDLQPVGPYILFGYSVAGRLTFQLAKALENHGHEVSDIIFFDSYFHGGPDRIDDQYRNLIFRETEKDMEQMGLGFMKEKVIRKTIKYLEYNQDVITLEKINANVHLILSAGAQNHDGIDAKCWDRYIPKSSFIYNGFGEHRQMIDPGGPIEKNALITKKILAKIETGSRAITSS